MLWQSSVEVVEQQQPILIERLEVRTDSGGAGEWEGAPGAHCVFRAREDAVRFMINSASKEFPPLGIRGGKAGSSMRITKVASDGSVEEQPISVDVVLSPGERLVSEACGGGGYGNPAARDPERVRLGVIDERISAERARDIYGVALSGEGMNRTVDAEQTRKLRATLKNGRGA
jgi:N-methylhydantoinase B